MNNDNANASFYLKSSMDRFIVFAISDRQGVYRNLKSSMDRFIGTYLIVKIKSCPI